METLSGQLGGVHPLGVQRHTALHRVFIEIPLPGHIEVTVPAGQREALLGGVLRAGHLLAQLHLLVRDGGAAVALEPHSAFVRHHHGHVTASGGVAVHAALDGHLHFRVADHRGTGGADDLQLECADHGGGVPVLAAAHGHEVHVERPQAAPQGDVRRLDGGRRHGAVLHQLKKLRVVAQLVLHGVHGVALVRVGTLQGQRHRNDIAGGGLLRVAAVDGQLK